MSKRPDGCHGIPPAYAQAPCDHVVESWDVCPSVEGSTWDAVSECSLCGTRLYVRRTVEKLGDSCCFYMYVGRADTHRPYVRTPCMFLRGVEQISQPLSTSQWRAVFDARRMMKSRENRLSFVEWLRSTFGGHPLSEWADIAKSELHKEKTMSKRLDDLTREMERVEEFCLGAGELHSSEVFPPYPNGLAGILRLSGGLLYPIGKESAKGNARLFAQLVLTILGDMRKDPRYGLAAVPDHCPEAASTILTLEDHGVPVDGKLVCYILHQVSLLAEMWAWEEVYAPEPYRIGLAAENLARHALALAWHRDPEAAAARD